MKRSAKSLRPAVHALSLAALLAPGFAAAGGEASAPVGRTAAAHPITVSLYLPSRDPAGARDFATRVGTPGDAAFRHYLTPAQYADRFGASQADYHAVVAWAKSQGLTVGERFAGRTVIPVSGSAASLGAALGVTFNDFKDAHGRVFYAADAKPHLPEAVAAKLGGVVGLSNAAHYTPMFVRVPAGQHPLAYGNGPGGAYSADDLRSIYGVTKLTYGKNTQTLGIFEQGGFDPNDVATYMARNNLMRPVPVTPRSVNGYGTGIDDPGVELEAVLDIDMQIAMNPQAKDIIVYEDGSDTFQVALVDSFAAMASDGVAKSISVSYGQDETMQGADAIAAENTVLTQLAAQGQAVFVSSGDDGAYGNFSLPLNVSDPASQPFVTGVGGTTLFSARGPRYQAEEVWNDLGVGAGATGGGISSVWPIPSYQLQGGNSVAAANGGSATLRNVPDVASVGNPLTGVAIYSKLNGGWITLGGTSVSAPIWAGFYSLVTESSEAFGFGAPGFANPSLYSLASSFSILVFPAFNDVIDGTNGSVSLTGIAGFNAGFGYDNTTGLGSFSGGNTLADLVLAPVLNGTNPPAAPRGVSVTAEPTKATVTWSSVAGVKGYFLFAFNYKTGATAASLLEKKTTATLTGLKPNSTYEAEIVSATIGGFAVSAPNIFTTPK